VDRDRDPVASISAAGATATAASQKKVAPRKDLDKAVSHEYRMRLAKRWPATPSLSSSDLRRALVEMPDATPHDVAAVLVDRYQLPPAEREPLRLRLAGMVHERRESQAEVRRMLPTGDVDLGDAVTCLQRLQQWADEEHRPPLHPFE